MCIRDRIVSFNGVILNIPISSEDLHCFGRVSSTHLTGEQLCLGTFSRAELSVHLEPRSLMGEKPSRVEILVHVRELPLDTLELGYRPAECSALLHVFRSGVKGRLRYPHSLSLIHI